MWIDERGSEVLGAPECRRLLALGAKEHVHGHLGFSDGEAPVVLPLDYSMQDSDIVVRVGEGLFGHMVGKLVAFQVDARSGRPGLRGVEDESWWSVMTQGLATETPIEAVAAHLPEPHVREPGRRTLRIRTDVLSGRWLGAPRSATGPVGQPEAERRRGAERKRTSRHNS